MLAVYPFPCQPAITQALVAASQRPVFNGVGTSYNDTSENYGAYAFTTLDTSADKSGTTYDYVFLGDPTTGEDIFGADESFEGLDLTGKIVLISRGGGVSFSVQANNAAVAIRRIFFMAFSLILYE